MKNNMKLFYNDDYVAAKYAYDTTRKAQYIHQSLMDDPIGNISIYTPHLFTDRTKELISTVHDGDYVDAVRTGNPAQKAESQGFDWDDGIWDMAVAHSTGLVAATTEAISAETRAGSLSSGLHHANRSGGRGFCTINGLAVAAKQAVEMDAPRVLILDFDAHAGGGTWDIISNHLPSVVQIDVTCSPFDTYEPTGESMLTLCDAHDYREKIKYALGYASLRSTIDPYDLIIYNAGMDPLNSRVSLNDIFYREKAVSDFIGDSPAIFALAGGYTWGDTTMDELVSWHRITIDTWANSNY